MAETERVRTFLSTEHAPPRRHHRDYRAPVTTRDAWRTVMATRRPPRTTDADNRLVLLGTAGGSNPKATRCGYSNAVVVGDAAYLVDCGEGVHRQMWRAGLTANPNFDRANPRPLVRAAFFTHLHIDHVVDLANIVHGSWPPQRLDLYGPGPAGLPIGGHADPIHPLHNPDEPTPGLRSMTEHLHRAFAYNLNVRVASEGRAPVTDNVHVHEIGVVRPGYDPDIDLGVSVVPDAETVPAMEPVVIYPTDDHGVTVSAILVQHSPVFPALGYRIDTPGGSVVFSDDTGPCDNVVRLAQGADILVHEVFDLDMLARRIEHLPNAAVLRAHLAQSHTPATEVGAIAQRAGVRTLVLSHLVPAELVHDEARWEAMVRPTFDGEIVCGVDLDEFALG